MKTILQALIAGVILQLAVGCGKAPEAGSASTADGKPAKPLTAEEQAARLEMQTQVAAAMKEIAAAQKDREYDQAAERAKKALETPNLDEANKQKLEKMVKEFEQKAAGVD